VLEKDLDAVLEEITKEVEKASPGVVVVDSFRTVVRRRRAAQPKWSCNLSFSG